MVQITMQLPDPLARQVLPARRWLPAVLELSLARLKTPAAEMSSEIIDFLDAEIIPLTAEGRVTARVLRFNDPDRLTERRRLIAARLFW